MSGEREIGLKTLFTKCAKKYNDAQIVEIPFDIGDRGNENTCNIIYSMCYNKNKPELKQFCGPDWVFYHWPTASIYSFENTRNEIIAAGLQYPKPINNKVVWYGNIYSPLNDVIEYHTRPLLKKLGDTYPDILEIEHIAPQNNMIDNKIANYKSLPDLVKYKYVLDIGGNGYSGRLKFLMYSKRPLLIVERKYIEYFMDDLQPYIHYIPVNEDLSNLLEQIKWCNNNYETAKNIALNAFEYAMTYFTEDKLMEQIYFVYDKIKNGR